MTADVTRGHLSFYYDYFDNQVLLSGLSSLPVTVCVLSGLHCSERLSESFHLTVHQLPLLGGAGIRLASSSSSNAAGESGPVHMKQMLQHPVTFPVLPGE